MLRPRWDHGAEAWAGGLPHSELFTDLLDVVLTAASPGRSDVVVDLGAGAGFLSIPFAERSRRVYAVDASGAMLALLGQSAERRALAIETIRCDVRRFAPAEPVDVVVSNYALHHLRRADKEALLAACHAWLRPGGRVVIGDLMVPLTLRPGQAGPLVAKVRSIARRGPSGYWRIAKNGVRWASGRGEYPAALESWTETLLDVGFRDVGGTRVGRESGVVWGTRSSE